MTAAYNARDWKTWPRCDKCNRPIDAHWIGEHVTACDGDGFSTCRKFGCGRKHVTVEQGDRLCERHCLVIPVVRERRSKRFWRALR